MQRRDFIKSSCLAGLIGVGTIDAAISPSNSHDPKVSKSKQLPLRVLHLTDIHICPEENAPDRCKKLIKRIRSQAGKIDFVLTGGDSIFKGDADDIGRQRILEQWSLWDDVVVKGLDDLEVYSCLGNHDMWWNGPEDDPMRGKSYACKRLNMPNRYYAFNKGNWRIIILDCNNDEILDQVQFKWLEKQVKSLKKSQPVLVMSHQPMLFYGTLVEGLSGRQREIIDLLRNIPHRAHFISGHIHEIDSIRFHNLSFHCNGALCGHWWTAGPEKDGCARNSTPMGYAMLELYPDGQLKCDYYDIGDFKAPLAT